MSSSRMTMSLVVLPSPPPAASSGSFEVTGDERHGWCRVEVVVGVRGRFDCRRDLITGVETHEDRVVVGRADSFGSNRASCAGPLERHVVVEDVGLVGVDVLLRRARDLVDQPVAWSR
jgi:hypothetical protein